MFRSRLPFPPPPPRWWVHHDWKIYRFGDKEIGIGQTELTEIEKSMPKVEVLHDELRKAAKESGLFMAVLVLTDILEERSLMLVNDEKGLGLPMHSAHRRMLTDSWSCLGSCRGKSRWCRRWPQRSSKVAPPRVA
jgi:hypothetical protein